LKVLIVVNPAASSVTPRGRVVISKAFDWLGEVRVVSTTHRNHATELATAAVHDGTEVVVALGGDGTLNEVAGALAGSEVRLAVLPGGSTNVFARAIGLSDDPVEAAAQQITALADRGAHEEHMGLGWANGRVFVFHAGIGFDAAVVHEVEKRGHLKRWIAHPLFIAAAFRTWASYDRQARFQVGVDGGPPAATPLTLILNRDPYTYLGERPLTLARGVNFDHGLSVCRFDSLSMAGIVLTAGRALLSPAGFTGSQEVHLSHGARQVIASSSGKPFAYQLDGDYIGETDRLVVEHRPRSLWLVKPNTAEQAVPPAA